MKLYATIKSERASKGQGGNSFLTITLFNEESEPIGDILYSRCEHDEPCHTPRYLASVRVFAKGLAVETTDYPDNALPPYLEAEKD